MFKSAKINVSLLLNLKLDPFAFEVQYSTFSGILASTTSRRNGGNAVFVRVNGVEILCVVENLSWAGDGNNILFVLLYVTTHINTMYWFLFFFFYS